MKLKTDTKNMTSSNNCQRNITYDTQHTALDYYKAILYRTECKKRA